LPEPVAVFLDMILEDARVTGAGHEAAKRREAVTSQAAS